MNYPENGKIFDISVLLTYPVARLNYIIKTKTVFFLNNNHENNEKNAGYLQGLFADILLGEFLPNVSSPPPQKKSALKLHIVNNVFA